jgi:hypothetical protein
MISIHNLPELFHAARYLHGAFQRFDPARFKVSFRVWPLVFLFFGISFYSGREVDGGFYLALKFGS